MSDVTLQDVLKAARMLPPDDQMKLREYLEHGALEPQNSERSIQDSRFPSKTYGPEYAWLREHAKEYAGNWVALDGDRLVSHGTDVCRVHAAAQADGVEFPCLVQIEPTDLLPFGGW